MVVIDLYQAEQTAREAHGGSSDKTPLVDLEDDSEFGGRYRAHHYAAYRGHLAVCQLLHQAGAKVGSYMESIPL